MNCKFIRWILGVLGFTTVATSCEMIDEIGGGGQVCMYGCPSADYVFNVEVADKENDQPIAHIRVSAILTSERSYWDNETGSTQYGVVHDTLAVGRTGEDGKLSLQFNNFPHDKHTIAFDDLDGAENGGDYASMAVDITSDGEDYKDSGNDGWYWGTATHNVAVKLSKKSE